MSKYSKKILNLNNGNNNLKHSHKNLSNWQCFQKHIIPSLEGPRQQRNIEAAKIWKTKSLNQKNKYDCSADNNDAKFSHKNKTSSSLKSDNENKIDDSIVESLLNEIEEAKNYQLEIPDLDYKTTTINTEMLKNINFKYEQIKNNLSYTNSDNFKHLKKQIAEIKSWLEEKENDNQSSYDDLQKELKSINQTSTTIENLEQKVIGNTSPKLKNSLLIETAKNNSIILKQIENLLNISHNYSNLKIKKLNNLIHQCQSLISKIYDNYEQTIGKTEIFVRLETRLQEMKKITMKLNIPTLEKYNLVLSKVKII